MAEPGPTQQFDEQWRLALQAPTLSPPQIQDYLPASDSTDVRSQVLADLIEIDLEYRWRLLEYSAEKATGPFFEVQVPDPEDYRTIWQQVLPDRELPVSLQQLADKLSQEAIQRIPGFMPRIPGFEMLSLLGAGSAAIVCRARRMSDGQDVAVKILRTVYGHPDRPPLRRLRQEYQILRSLEHPHLTKALELNCHRGLWYLTEELVEGKDLEEFLRLELREQRLIDPGLAAEWIRQAALAVHYLHSHQVLHRDVKPSNLLLSETGSIRITDLGLSRRIPDSDLGRLEGRPQTASGTLLGTPAYLAPEQIRSSSSRLTASVDIYGLGASLYHLLAGRPPFVSASLYDLLRQILEQDPYSPSLFRADIPTPLQSICLKCLEKVPSRRYRSAQDLADDLTRFLQGQATAAQPIGIWGRLIRRSQRRPAIAALVLSLSVAMVVLIWTTVSGSISKSLSLQVLSRQQKQLQESLTREREAHRRARDSLSRQAFLEFRANRLKNMRSLLQEMSELEPESTRRWEWKYLTFLADDRHQRVFSLDAPLAEWITAFAFSPDGRWLAAGSGVPVYRDRKSTATAALKVWDTSTWELKLDLTGEVLSVAQLLFTPDGRELLVLERDNGVFHPDPIFSGPSRIRRFETQTFRELPSITAASQAARMAFSPQGQLIVAEANEAARGRLFVMDGPAGVASEFRVVQTHSGWEYAERSPGFLPLAEGASQPADAAPEIIPVLGVLPIRSPEGMYDVRAWYGHHFRLEADLDRYSAVSCFNSMTGELQRTVEVEGFESAALSPSEELMAVASRRGEIEIRETESWRRRLILRGHTARVRTLEFSPDQQLLCSGDWERQVRVWNLRSPGEFHELLPPKKGNDTAAFAVLPDGRIIALTAGHPVRIVNPDTEELLDGFAVPFSEHVSAPGRKAAFTPTGDRLCTVNFENPQTISVFECRHGSLTQELQGHNVPVRHLRACDDVILSLAWPASDVSTRWQTSGEIRVWNKEGHVRFADTLPGARIFRADISPDRKWLAASLEEWDSSGASRSSVRIWDLTTGTVVRSLPTRSWVLALKFSPSTSLLAASDFDFGDWWLHDAASGKTRLSMQESIPQAQDLCLVDEDSRLLAASRFDLRLMNAETGSEILNQNLITFPVDYIFNPQIVFDGQKGRVLVNQADGSIRVLGGLW